MAAVMTEARNRKQLGTVTAIGRKPDAAVFCLGAYTGAVADASEMTDVTVRVIDGDDFDDLSREPCR